MKDTLSRYLTLRYALALFLVFLVLLFTLFTFLTQISTAQNDAYIINISGMQRMLSQRIGLMARELQMSESLSEADPYVMKLQQAIDKMQENHIQLISGNLNNGVEVPLSDEIRALYFDSNGVDQQVKEYLNNASRLITVLETNGPKSDELNIYVDSVVSIARNGLLADLNSVVQRYEAEASKRIARFALIKKVAFISGVIILLLEVFFIFKPMVRRIVNSTEALESRNQELIEFSYRISHDVRSPIKSISGLVNVTETALKMEKHDRVVTAIKHMKSSINQLEKLTDDIIELTKMKMIKADIETVDVKQLLTQCVDSLRFLEGFNDIQIAVRTSIEEEQSFQRLYVQQIMENLISNSIKYLDEQKDPPSIIVEANLRGDLLEMSVTDNGLGIPEPYRDKLFTMFQRFHPKVSFGSGLGLYLVAQNAKALNGKIDYTPLSSGSRFTLTFPVEEREK